MTDFLASLFLVSTVCLILSMGYGLVCAASLKPADAAAVVVMITQSFDRARAHRSYAIDAVSPAQSVRRMMP